MLNENNSEDDEQIAEEEIEKLQNFLEDPCLITEYSEDSFDSWSVFEGPINLYNKHPLLETVLKRKIHPFPSLNLYNREQFERLVKPDNVFDLMMFSAGYRRFDAKLTGIILFHYPNQLILV
jgi:hypothetical protein